jgi:LacI family transcriptional regulator
MVQFRTQGVPMVSLDFPIPGMPSVTVDNAAGSAKATRQLQRTGASRLGLISGPTAALAFRQREAGFITVAGSAAPVMRAEAVTIEAGRAAAAALLDAFPATDGIVTVNDLLAVGALSEARARGRQVPDDLQIIGFDDQPLMEVIGMSTVRQPMGEFGSWAAQAITALLARPLIPGAAPVAVASVELPLSLVLRATTRPAAGGRRAGGRPAPA